MSPTQPLLGLLVRGERHGYELKRIVDAEFAPYWRIDFAQLYRSLAKMTRAGWVKSRVERGAGPARKVYGLTARGRSVLDDWLAQPAHDHAEFNIKLRLAADAGTPAGALIAAERRRVEEEHAARIRTAHAARAAKDIGQIVLAEAARQQTEAHLTALHLSEAVLPAKRRSAHGEPSAVLVVTGSDDPLLARLAELAHTSTHPVGSIAGLVALAQNQADVAGVHLRDAETGEYNLPFVKHILPEGNSVLVNLAFRENGLLLAPGNPQHIRGLRDLARCDVRLVNRARGTGTRLWLYSKLRAARIDPHSLRGWENAVSTHAAVAAAIATGAADVGPGLRATAVAWNLEFIPLGAERYDLVIPYTEFESPRLRPLLSALHSDKFRAAAAGFAGYDLARTGQVIARVK